MYYHFAILLLFGPFLKLRFIGSHLSPTEICYEAADAIISLVGSYRQLYSLRRTPCFVPYIVLASSIMCLATPTDAAVPAFSFNPMLIQRQKGETYLHEMVSSHSFARRGMEVIRVMVQNQADKVTQPPGPKAEDPELKATTTGGMNFFSSDMENAMETKKSAMQNSIFSPFPTQILPLLAAEKQLHRDGYELIK